ncbi:competence type IV pilus assembly protein ComGB [Pseudogracilibacillus sp. SE30717A]|uniref:competence type IV pilus assembly protein ComGB n=1 Tax=Pseudogracilibacillus sp. SE30717A TaxID=3098293 RepID=UPI00300E5593
MVSYLKKRLRITNIRPDVKEQIQLRFLQRLHRLLKSGYSLLAALEVMQWDQELKQSAEKVENALKKGNPIDEAFDEASFHRTIVAYLYFVRINGNLLASLEKCLIMFDNRITYRKKFVQVIRYPIVLSFTFIILLVFLKYSVLPSFLELFTTNTESSNAVLYSIITIDLVSTLFIILSLIFFVGLGVWTSVKEKISVQTQISIFKRIPILKSFTKMQTSYYFSTHLSMFLKAGLTLKDTLTNMSDQDKLPIVSYYSSLMIDQFSNGLYIDHLLKELPFIDKTLANLFQKNMNASTLANDLAIYADFLAEDMEQKVMRFITLIQPLFFVLLACFIILVYMTLMLPMFQLIQTV